MKTHAILRDTTENEVTLLKDLYRGDWFRCSDGISSWIAIKGDDQVSQNKMICAKISPLNQMGILARIGNDEPVTKIDEVEIKLGV